MSTSTSGGGSRREFLQQAAFLSSLAAVGGLETVSGQTQPSEPQNVGVKPVPWYRRTYRWCQTNIAEADVTRYDIAWWRQHWKRTEVQGVIINAGGIVAYYPSKFPLHYRPPALGDRDLYGEIAKAAREDGITVLARMDSSRAHEPFYRAHPDWFCVDANGQVVQGAGLYTACINGPYFDEYLPDVLREIIDRSHPDGFTDNNWTGLGRNSICHCANCARRFREYGGKDLPRQQNWDDQNYRKWIEWSYARRLEVWDAFNKVTREAGGPDCLWLGMNGGGIGGQSSSFRDYKEICDRSEIVMLDHQFRSQADGLQHNALAGKMIHGLLGWDKLIPESMPMYQNGTPATFRLTVKPPAEAKMWMLSGFAGGIQPWYHHIGAYHEDRRAYQIAEPLMKWHKANEQYLVNRKPVANVGVVWSQRNTDFYGRENPELRVEQPWRGFTQALIRARIPFLPVHIDHIDRESPNLSVLIMPNIAAMTDQQIASVRKFVERGGSLVATGDTSLCDEWGDARADYALADLFGVKGGKLHREASSERARAGEAVHSYLRLTPELRANVYGPKSGNEPIAAADQKRHPVLAGFDQTDILEYGGTLDSLTVNPEAKVLLTFIPTFPVTPPEKIFMRQERTDIPGLIVREAGQSRIAFLPADIDRRFAIDNFPDHGDLLANLVRWAARDTYPLEVTGPGLISCELYQQPGRIILHLLNVTSAGTWRAPVHELIAIGPTQVKIRVPQGAAPKRVRMLVAGETQPMKTEGAFATVEIKSLLDHEVVVLET